MTANSYIQLYKAKEKAIAIAFTIAREIDAKHQPNHIEIIPHIGLYVNTSKAFTSTLYGLVMKY